MTSSIRPGMAVYACNGRRIGKVRHLFSASETTREAIGNSADPASPNVDSDTLGHISGMSAMYDIGTFDTKGSGAAQGQGIPPFFDSADDAGHFASSDTKYLEIQHVGLRHPRTATLYVPYSAVSAISVKAVTLDCTMDEVIKRFSTAPLSDDAH